MMFLKHILVEIHVIIQIKERKSKHFAHLQLYRKTNHIRGV